MAIDTYQPTDSGLMVPVDYSRSIENPAIPLSDPAAMQHLGMSTGSSSVVVNERTVLRFGPFFRGVNLLSDSFASLPLDVMARLQPSGKIKDKSHAAYHALRWMPNRLQTAYIFKKQMMAAAIIWGNGYAFIDRSDPNRTRLSLLLPDRTRPYQDEHGTQWYETFINRGTTRKVLFPDEVLHLRGMSADSGMMGLPLVGLMKRTAQLGLSAERYGIHFFDNGARASGVMTYPPKMSKRAQRALREGVEKRKAGLDNASKVMVLSEGVKWQALTINQDEAQFLETRQFQAREVAVWLGIPPNKLGDNTNTSYASLEQENQAYLNEGVNPWLVNFEQECRDKLLAETEKETDSHVVKFNRRGFVQADLSTRTEAYNKGIMGSWLNPDEARDAEDMNPIPDGEGEKFLRPANMVVVGEEPVTPPVEDEDDYESASRFLLLHVFRGMADLEISVIDRASNRKTGLSIDEECEKHRARMSEKLAPVLAVVSPWVDAEQCAERWIKNTLSLINAGADLLAMSDHRCLEMVRQIFGEK